MALPGETLKLGAAPVCDGCGVRVVLAVYRSAGGWYVGTCCNCGPYTRESGYYRTREEAERALKGGSYGR